MSSTKRAIALFAKSGFRFFIGTIQSRSLSVAKIVSKSLFVLNATTFSMPMRWRLLRNEKVVGKSASNTGQAQPWKTTQASG
ncbi:hypothetical protein LU11_gp182 [Pseudomonas phage Lu11]|uniref:hypothetical protein n=1 Tax=Pseudomonas phage Lu11 TaxID=1161927 RepID=UPI00025F17DC|nr:hypothetical protein LU11_gp182 [Pseudomonas phage Lu11]AFH14713.1 hypothetical protein Lu11_0176A [Pseudomonas phage Lu11]